MLDAAMDWQRQLIKQRCMLGCLEDGAVGLGRFLCVEASLSSWYLQRGLSGQLIGLGPIRVGRQRRQLRGAIFEVSHCGRAWQPLSASLTAHEMSNSAQPATNSTPALSKTCSVSPPAQGLYRQLHLGLSRRRSHSPVLQHAPSLRSHRGDSLYLPPFPPQPNRRTDPALSLIPIMCNRRPRPKVFDPPSTYPPRPMPDDPRRFRRVDEAVRDDTPAPPMATCQASRF